MSGVLYLTLEIQNIFVFLYRQRSTRGISENEKRSSWSECSKTHFTFLETFAKVSMMRNKRTRVKVSTHIESYRIGIFLLFTLALAWYVLYNVTVRV